MDIPQGRDLQIKRVHRRWGMVNIPKVGRSRQAHSWRQARHRRVGGNLPASAGRALQFPPEDEAWASGHIPGGDVRVIPGEWGHLTGAGANPDDVEFIGRAVRELLASPGEN
ncbi:hypothetical protein SAZ11_27565 [Streptomyces sp. FXJ1.4098]|nr:hypothetical protein [Streptomyces sp. FXJ1.4098]